MLDEEAAALFRKYYPNCTAMHGNLAEMVESGFTGSPAGMGTEKVLDRLLSSFFL